MKNWTFAQFFSAGICLLCVLFLAGEFAYVVKNPGCLKDPTTVGFLSTISMAIIGAFAKAYTFVLGDTAASQNKDNVIANSTPVTPAPKNP